MASSLVYTLIASTVIVVQAQGNLDKRELDLPAFNPLDPIGSFNNLLSFNKTVSEVANQAISVGVETKNEIGQLAEETLNNTKQDIHNLVEGASTQLKQNLEAGPFASTVKGVACLGNGTSAAVSAGKETLNKVVTCITDQANSFFEPAGNLIKQGEKGVVLGLQLSQNLTSCFPFGFHPNPFTLLQNLFCAFGKISPAFSEINDIISSTEKNVEAIQESFTNTKNAIAKCPMERIAELIIQLGNIVSKFGKCIDDIYKDTTTVAPTNVTS